MDAEYKRIALRFGDRLQAGESTGAFAVSLYVRDDAGVLPTTLSALTLEVTVPAGYPAVSATFRVAPGAALPPAIALALEKVINTQFGGDKHAPHSPSATYDALRWLDAHVGELLASIVTLQAEVQRRAAPSVTDAAAHAPPPATGSEAADHPAAAVAATSAAPAAPGVTPPHPPSASWTTATGAGEPWKHLFAAPWTLEEQVDWEAAIRELSRELGGFDPARVATWRTVADAVGGGGGRKTPEDCLARYLVLRAVGRRWYAMCRRPLERAWKEGEEALVAAADAAAAEAAAAVAAARAALTRGDGEGGGGAGGVYSSDDEDDDDDDGGDEEGSGEEESSADDDDVEADDARMLVSPTPAGAAPDAEQPLEEGEEFLPAFTGLFLRASHSGTTLRFEGMNAYG